MARGDVVGFTLTEILLTVVIIGIVATVTLPSYQRLFEHANGRESETSLRILYQAEQAYYYSKSPPNNVYGWYNVQGQANDLAPYIPANLNSTEWAYSVTPDNTATPRNFLATATRLRGPRATETRTTDRSGVSSPATWQ